MNKWVNSEQSSEQNPLNLYIVKPNTVRQYVIAFNTQSPALSNLITKQVVEHT